MWISTMFSVTPPKPPSHPQNPRKSAGVWFFQNAGGGQVCGGLRGARVLRTRAPPRGGRYKIKFI